MGWDELGKILVLLIIARLIPTGTIWLVVDDTLCHKRGAKVAFGGFFLDAVTSTKKKKNVRFGVNWVVLGLAVRLPCRADRTFCLPVVWRAYRKKGTAGHRTRTALAAEMARSVATWLPDRECWLVGDMAYLNATVMRDRPANLRVLGPVRWDAAVYALPRDRPAGAKSRPRKKGDRLPTPREMIADPVTDPGTEQDVTLGTTVRRLRTQVVRDVLWYTGTGTEPVTLVLVRDVAGQWRDEALLATARDASAADMIAG
ncbi:MAG TPA: transposase [Urbifossiella sp.]|nr:transposase [Urbifossiella sp.]